MTTAGIWVQVPGRRWTVRYVQYKATTSSYNRADKTTLIKRNSTFRAAALVFTIISSLAPLGHHKSQPIVSRRRVFYFSIAFLSFLIATCAIVQLINSLILSHDHKIILLYFSSLSCKAHGCSLMTMKKEKVIRHCDPLFEAIF